MPVSITEMNDEQLIRALQPGNTAVLQQIRKRYHKYLITLAFKIMKYYHYPESLEEARDVVQECYISFWNKRAAFEAKGFNIRTYLCGAVRHQCNNRLDRYKTRHKVHTAMMREHRDPYLPDLLESKELMLAITNRILSLPTLQRKVSIERLLEGKTYKEISVSQQITEQTVKSTLKISKKKLRILLREFK